PFSYFCTCWNVTPMRCARADCDIPASTRRARTRAPIPTSRPSARLPPPRRGLLRRVMGARSHPIARRGVDDELRALALQDNRIHRPFLERDVRSTTRLFDFIDIGAEIAGRQRLAAMRRGVGHRAARDLEYARAARPLAVQLGWNLVAACAQHAGKRK